MEVLNNEKKEICTIDNKKFTVITRKATECLSKEKLIQLIVNYAIRELNKEDD